MTSTWVERYRDVHLLIVEKPAGLPSQAPAGGGPNLFDSVRATHGSAALHHRLDQPVSGLVLFTLNPAVNAAVTNALRNHTLERLYLGCVLGDPGESGSWNSPVDGKTAITHYRRLSTDGRRSLLSIRLETGRTHQIRRHARDAGHPVLGDRRYGSAAGTLFSRVALHAERIRWTHPITGAALDISSPPPADLAALAGSIAG